jgi:dihydrolipoamide dehydrogenase
VQTVDVAIIGAGSAGIAARAEVARMTDAYVVIDNGVWERPARVGCMPSKGFIQVANDFYLARLREDGAFTAPTD